MKLGEQKNGPLVELLIKHNRGGKGGKCNYKKQDSAGGENERKNKKICFLVITKELSKVKRKKNQRLFLPISELGRTKSLIYWHKTYFKILERINIKSSLITSADFIIFIQYLCIVPGSVLSNMQSSQFSPISGNYCNYQQFGYLGKFIYETFLDRSEKFKILVYRIYMQIHGKRILLHIS